VFPSSRERYRALAHSLSPFRPGVPLRWARGRGRSGFCAICMSGASASRPSGRAKVAIDRCSEKRQSATPRN